MERDQETENRKVSVIEECMEIFIFRDDPKNVGDHKACSKYRHYKFSQESKADGGTTYMEWGFSRYKLLNFAWSWRILSLSDSMPTINQVELVKSNPRTFFIFYCETG